MQLDGYVSISKKWKKKFCGNVDESHWAYVNANTFYCLVLECASGGDLQAYIKSYKDCFLPEEKARPYLRQLVSAVHYLHERGVSHRHSSFGNWICIERLRAHTGRNGGLIYGIRTS
ncbi:hypothetical protein KUTeg_016806 [Tegillarca granosa]|uniref:Protein kinase domain-containing protein n=1 Tax=Tegillarca granosa TaxID=220873 RepID=A0ABQ9EM03_TEGGR|nr:hypothetical protein KUTeg_016806 [Tegillarca granosa]